MTAPDTAPINVPTTGVPTAVPTTAPATAPPSVPLAAPFSSLERSSSFLSSSSIMMGHLCSRRRQSAQTHFRDFLPVFFLGVHSEQQLDSSEKARIIQPDFRALGIEPQQSEFWIVLAARKPRRDKSIPIPVDGGPVVVERQRAMHRREQSVVLGGECSDGVCAAN